MDLLRIVIDARRIGSVAGTNAITIHDTPERITAAGRLIAMIDKARPEVLIDVELLEVNRTRLREYGLQLASPNSSGISGVADVNKPGLTFDDLRNLNGSQILMTAVPGSYYRLLKEDRYDSRSRQPTASHAGGPIRASAVWRADSDSGDDVFPDCHWWRRAATDHLVQLRKHRRQHRHHTSHALR